MANFHIWVGSASLRLEWADEPATGSAAAADGHRSRPLRARDPPRYPHRPFALANGWRYYTPALATLFAFLPPRVVVRQLCR